MTHRKRVAEATPRIYFSDVKPYIGDRVNAIQLSLTTNGQIISCRVRTTSTPCYFRGKRRWFLCGACGRRAGVLFSNITGTNLLCRQCSNISYRSQGHSGSSRVLMRLFDTEEKISTVFDTVQRVHLLHRGQPTRRLKRYRAYCQRMELLLAKSLG